MGQKSLKYKNKPDNIIDKVLINRQFCYKTRNREKTFRIDIDYKP